jgi:hypothetical protein
VPIDTARADVSHCCSESSERRDADVCSGTRGRARSGQHYDRQADVAENQADETARQRGGEAPERDEDQDESVQALEYRA